MNEEALSNAWATLEPTGHRRQRIDARVSAWLEAHDTSLAAEWLGIFKVAPVPAFGLAMASAVSIAVAPPFVWLALSLM